MKEIDMTPKWEAIIPVLIELTANDDDFARKSARDEITRLAVHADSVNEFMPEVAEALGFCVEAIELMLKHGTFSNDEAHAKGLNALIKANGLKQFITNQNKRRNKQ